LFSFFQYYYQDILYFGLVPIVLIVASCGFVNLLHKCCKKSPVQGSIFRGSQRPAKRRRGRNLSEDDDEIEMQVETDNTPRQHRDPNIYGIGCLSTTTFTRGPTNAAPTRHARADTTPSRAETTPPLPINTCTTVAIMSNPFSRSSSPVQSHDEIEMGVINNAAEQ
jgi:hypothetical protein